MYKLLFRSGRFLWTLLSLKNVIFGIARLYVCSSATMESNTFWRNMWCIFTYCVFHFSETFSYETVMLQVKLCQKLLFLHQLTHNTYDDRLFIELQVQYMKIPSSNLGRTCCVKKLFLTLRTIFVHNMFSLCSAKRRASDKDLPVRYA